jgi:para-nitrobenzyl esterase
VLPLRAHHVASLLLLSLACFRSAPEFRAPDPSQPRVTIEQGVVEGRADTSPGVLVFRGIRYAAPPVGERRWRPPEPVQRWTGVQSAERLGRNCMQAQIYGDIDPFAAGVSEDCLFLNVWTTGLEAPVRPVMVWIHGGGYVAGFGGEDRHDGARLARKGAVVVTINYRLGVFGFLAHPALAAESPHGATGNYGLLDQIAALQWVQRNVARFGGDPSRITIFGESAGGFSVGALVASPLARGLFQRAILESGTGLGTTQPQDSAEARGARFAELLGVAGRDAATAARLRMVSADTLVAVSRRAPIVPLRPVVDGLVLPRSVDSLVAGMPTGVPVIVGSNGDEGDAFFGAPARAFARLMTAHDAPAYLYQFTRVGDDSVNRKRGAYHSAEITFVFGRPRPILQNAGHTAYDSTLADAMSDYWVAFARSADPNGPPSAGRWPRWPAYDPLSDTYLELGPEIVAKQGLKRATYDSLDQVARRRGEMRP